VRATVRTYCDLMTEEPRPPLVVRWGAGRWLAMDWVVAGLYGLLVWAALPRLRFEPLLPLLIVALVGLPIALARRRPLAGFAVVLVAGWLGMAGIGSLEWILLAPAGLVLYVVAARCSTAVALSCLALSMWVAVATALPDFRSTGAVIPVAMLLVASWVLGRAVNQHRRYAEAVLAHRAEIAALEVERASRQAVEERLRIARDLHDLVAHSMSVITVQAGFGNLVFDDDQAAARQALGTIEYTGRQALTEMRQLLGVLRAPDGSPAAALRPAPGLGDLDGLVAATAAAGVQVEVVVTGTAVPLPPGPDSCAFRVVQEALTNVVKHAGADTARVSLDYRPDGLEIEIVDSGNAALAAGELAPGHGLVGMHERVALCGGTVSAEPRPEGGFRVSVRLPSAPGVVTAG
jgi:signal transduction histidine kinase